MTAEDEINDEPVRALMNQGQIRRGVGGGSRIHLSYGSTRDHVTCYVAEIDAGPWTFAARSAESFAEAVRKLLPILDLFQSIAASTTGADE